MKKLFLLCLIFISKLSFGQPIPSDFFGQNAWYSVYTSYTGPNTATVSTDYFIKHIADCKASGAKFCRIGGANANILGVPNGNPANVPLTKEQALFLIIKIREAGMEPIVQVPYFNTNNNNSTLPTAANEASVMVQYLNTTTVNIIPGGKVKYWIIGNEPDKDKNANNDKIGYNYNATLTAAPANIAAYIKRFAVEMRAADPDIKIIGPELASRGIISFSEELILRL